MATLTVHLVTRDRVRAGQWYASVLGAKELSRITLPDGAVLTIDLQFGDSQIAISGELADDGNRCPATLGYLTAPCTSRSRMPTPSGSARSGLGRRRSSPCTTRSGASAPGSSSTRSGPLGRGPAGPRRAARRGGSPGGRGLCRGRGRLSAGVQGTRFLGWRSRTAVSTMSCSSRAFAAHSTIVKPAVEPTARATSSSPLPLSPLCADPPREVAPPAHGGEAHLDRGGGAVVAPVEQDAGGPARLSRNGDPGRHAVHLPVPPQAHARRHRAGALGVPEPGS